MWGGFVARRAVVQGHGEGDSRPAHAFRHLADRDRLHDFRGIALEINDVDLVRVALPAALVVENRDITFRADDGL